MKYVNVLCKVGPEVRVPILCFLYTKKKFDDTLRHESVSCRLIKLDVSENVEWYENLGSQRIVTLTKATLNNYFRINSLISNDHDTLYMAKKENSDTVVIISRVHDKQCLAFVVKPDYNMKEYVGMTYAITDYSSYIPVEKGYSVLFEKDMLTGFVA